MVVTDWLSLSLYKIAVQQVKCQRKGVIGECDLSEPTSFSRGVETKHKESHLSVREVSHIVRRC